MAGNDDFAGEKRVEPAGGVQVRTRILDRHGRVWEHPFTPEFPMDSEAGYAFYSRMGGFVPVEVALDTIFSNPAHYGAGGFEGVRMLRTPYGDGFVELPHNLARFIYSSLAFNLSLIRDTIKLLDDPEVDRVEHLQRTPRDFFADSVWSLEKDSDVQMGVNIFYKDGSVKEDKVKFELRVKFDGTERKFSMKEMEAATCSLAFLNRLVRGPPFPAGGIALIPGAYFRHVFWYSGEGGLKVPTLFLKDGILVEKPLYFGIGTLPWAGRYLPDEGYKAGLRVLVAPLPRIDEAMPVTQKIAGNYVNSARNINIAMALGFGEILALNHKKEVVEGSAENIIVLFTDKRTGGMRAYCPPLSSNILAGTTRDRMLRVLGQGVEVSGRKPELVMEAPKLDFVLRSLEGRTDFEVSAVVLMGTGVGVVHARSITDNPKLREWMEVNALRSEEARSEPLELRRLKESEREYIINNGERHPFVEALQEAYNGLVLGEQGRLITPAYAMDFRAAERVFGVQLEEVASNDFIAKTEWGYFRERVNGIVQPDELMAKYREAAAVVRKMNGISIDRRTGGPGKKGAELLLSVAGR